MLLAHANIRELPSGISISFETEGGSCLVELVNKDNRKKADLVGKVAIKGPVTAGRPDYYCLPSRRVGHRAIDRFVVP